MEPRSRIVSLMYEAAVNPGLWPVALDALATEAQAGCANLSFYDKRAVLQPLAFVGGPVNIQDSLSPYVEYYHRVDPLYSAASALPVSERVMLCHEFVPQESAAKSEFYQDFLIPKMGQYRAGWHLESGADRLITLGLHKAKTRFERSEFAVWEPVARHARQAASLTAEISPRLARGELLRQAIDHLQFACIMVDSNARVLDCPAAAAALLENGKLLKLRDRSQLGTVSNEETERLRKLIASAATGRTGGLMRIAGHWLLQVVPSGAAQQNAFDPRFAYCALVFVTSPKLPTSLDWRRIQLALDCTPAEAEVAADLASGIAPNEIAAKRKVSLNTVRTQIRILLERTGLHRIAELVNFLFATR